MQRFINNLLIAVVACSFAFSSSLLLAKVPPEKAEEIKKLEKARGGKVMGQRVGKKVIKAFDLYNEDKVNEALEILTSRYIVPWHRLRFENLKKLSFDELIASRYDEYVVRLRDGTRPKALDKSFNQFLTKSKLLYGSTSEKKRTLYSLRHFYATTQLMQGRNIHSLAKQMGTSVGMIEKHYSKLTPMLMAEEFAGDD